MQVVGYICATELKKISNQKQRFMKKNMKIFKFIALLTLFSALYSCHDDLYNNHEHNLGENKNKITLSQFKSETKIKDFKTIIKSNIQAMKSTNRVAELSDFVIDTLAIKRHISQNNKTTYSFKIYPLSNVSQPNEIFNLVYRLESNNWEQSIFSLIKKSNPLPSEEQFENKTLLFDSKTTSTTARAGEMCISEMYYVQCDGSCHGQCDGFACPTGQCIQKTIIIDFCSGSGGATGGGGDPYGGGSSDFSQSGQQPSNPYEFTPNMFDNPVYDDPNYVNAIKAQHFFSNLSFAQQVWANENIEAYNQLIQHQIDNNWSNESEAFATELIDLASQNQQISNEIIFSTIAEKQNDSTLNLQQAFTLAVINNSENPMTGANVEFYLLLKYKNTSYFNRASFAVVSNSINVGTYTLTPHYKSDNTLVYYAAARYSGNNTLHDIEYIIKSSALSNFQENINLYTHAANLFYMHGTPSDGQIAFLAGDYFSGLSQMWNDAIHSPQWWAYSITCFGHAIVSLPVNTTVSSTITTHQWRSSMKNLTNRAFQGKTVSNPQGVNVTINIPDNYVPSISNNGQGINFRPSTPINPVYPDAGLIRVTQPGYSGGVYYPKGYVKFYNNYGQPYNPINGQTLSNANNHFKF